MEKINALLIDDDIQFCHSFQVLSKEIFHLTVAHNSRTGIKLLKRCPPDVVFLDYQLKEQKTGLDVLREIHQIEPDLPVIMVTQHEEIDIAVAAMRQGAFDFTTKTPNIKELRLRLEQKLRDYNWKLLCQAKDEQLYGRMIYKSPVMIHLLQMAQQIAAAEIPVLIQGETGTGKGLLAREIHRFSARANRPFVSVNCSNLPPNLFESELFGHTRGAFTGAFQNKKGKLELADSGTIFFDEIGALPLESQAKILTAIEDKVFVKVGGEKSQTVDVRVIAATNADLVEAIKTKVFREDLYYRLNVVTLKIPLLRERQEDIIPLAEAFLQNLTRPKIMQISEAAKRDLIKYHWPGNVRELKSVIQRSALFNPGPELQKVYLDTNVAFETDYLNWEELLALPYEQAKSMILTYFQQKYLKSLLKTHHGNISAAAEAGQLNRTTLHRLLKEQERDKS